MSLRRGELRAGPAGWAGGEGPREGAGLNAGEGHPEPGLEAHTDTSLELTPGWILQTFQGPPHPGAGGRENRAGKAALGQDWGVGKAWRQTPTEEAVPEACLRLA